MPAPSRSSHRCSQGHRFFCLTGGKLHIAMKKFSRVLLVDDYESDLVLTRLLLLEMGCADQVDFARNGAEALEYLGTHQDGDFPRPELICLDINMPVMNGWEFLEAYKTLPEEQTGGILLLMLTSLDKPDELTITQELQSPTEYSTKPLTEERVLALLDEYFPDS